MTAAAAILLLAALAAISASDAREMRVPDALSLPLAAVGLGLAAVEGRIWAAAAGAALGYLGLVAVEIAHRRLRGSDGLGRGDAKLLAAGGAWCGAAMLPAILSGAALGALAWLGLRRLAGRAPWPRAAPLPFAPFLSAAIFATWISGRAGVLPW